MATCGYLCPSCEGRGFMDDGTACIWCATDTDAGRPSQEQTCSDEEWLRSVHEGPCCSDRPEEES